MEVQGTSYTIYFAAMILKIDKGVKFHIIWAYEILEKPLLPTLFCAIVL
jgi:hypothetical protein